MYDPNQEERLIKEYLLGALGEEEERRFEERFLTDPPFRATALMVEEELIEAYVFGLLTGREREQFVSRFMSNPRQAARVNLVSQMHSYAAGRVDARASVEGEEDAHVSGAGDEAEARKSWPGWLAGPLRSRRRGLVLSFAVGLLLVALAGTFLLMYVRRAEDERASERRRREAVEREVGSLNSGPGAGQTQAGAGQTFAVILSPVVVRGAGEMPRVTAPPGAQVVQLRLTLLGEGGSYSATLLTDSGEELFTLHGLRPSAADGGSALHLNVPMSLLPAGDYQVRLRGPNGGGGQTGEVVYPFRVPSR